MKGVLRTAFLLLSWTPLQRWLLAIGLTLIAVGQLGQFRYRLAILAVLSGLALVLLPALIVGGVMFRSLSAPRTMRLIPHARLKLLLGVLLCLVLLAGFFTANMEFLKRAALSGLLPMSLTHILVGTMAAGTLLLLGMFFISSPRFALMWIVVLILWQFSSAPLARWSFIPAMAAQLGLANLAALLTVGVWSAFAAWYLRAPRIVSPFWTSMSGTGSYPLTKRERNIDTTRESAIAVHLLGLPSIGYLIWRGSTLFVLLLVLAFMTFLRPRAMMPNAGASLLFLGFIAIAFAGVVVAAGIAHRSRILWIGSGCAREELFRTCERLSWRCFAVIGAPMALLCVGAWIFLPHQATHWPYLLVATLAPAVCGLYLGLMSVTGWRLIDVVVGILIVSVGLMGGVVGPLFADTPIESALLWIPLAGLLGALSLRSVARRRWRRIDWLICKPPRLASQALRPVV